jgi:hypothetical protein
MSSCSVAARWNLDKKYRQLFEKSVNLKNFQEIKITDEFFRFFDIW